MNSTLHEPDLGAIATSASMRSPVAPRPAADRPGTTEDRRAELRRLAELLRADAVRLVRELAPTLTATWIPLAASVAALAKADEEVRE